jgi:hypothetical protein
MSTKALAAPAAIGAGKGLFDGPGPRVRPCRAAGICLIPGTQGIILPKHRFSRCGARRAPRYRAGFLRGRCDQ